MPRPGPAAPDELRTLTPAGREQARELGRRLREQGLEPDAVLSSPLLRARETAAALALGDAGGDERLAPGATPEDIRDAAARPRRDGARRRPPAGLRPGGRGVHERAGAAVSDRAATRSSSWTLREARSPSAACGSRTARSQRCRASTSRSSRARSSGCSARTARARRRRSRSSRGTARATRAR